MKKLLTLFSLVVLTTTNAFCNDLYVALGSYVHHTDRDKNLNEDNNLIGLRYGWDLNDTVTAGIMLQDFDNSINKDTTLLGGFLDKELYSKDKFSFGVGGTAAYQLRRGYNIPALANGYLYTEYDRYRINYMYIPPISDNVDEVFILSFELKL